MKKFKKHGYEFVEESDRIAVYSCRHFSTHLIGYFYPESEKDSLGSLEEYFDLFGENLTDEDVQEVVEYYL